MLQDLGYRLPRPEGADSFLRVGVGVLRHAHGPDRHRPARARDRLGNGRRLLPGPASLRDGWPAVRAWLFGRGGPLRAPLAPDLRRGPPRCRPLSVDGEPRTIVGVLSSGSSVPTRHEMCVSTTLQQRRLSTLLLSLFSAGALLLALLGIYATLAYSVVQRTREIGVRMALGARGGAVVRLVVGQGMRLAALGAGLGVAFALLLGRVIAALLYGVGPHDPVTFAAVVVLLLGAALLACWVPARRASRVDPLIALRAE